VTSAAHESIAARVERPPERQRLVAALTRAEGRRLVRHPIFLVGVGLSAFIFAIDHDVSAESARYHRFSVSLGSAYSNLMGWGLVWLAFATLLSVNLAVLRSRRDGTDETYRSLPAQLRTRTAAHLLAVLYAVGIGLALVAVDFLYQRAGNGLIVDYSDRTVVPSADELAQGVLAVLVFGIFGVALASWLPRFKVTLLVTFVLFASQWIYVSWIEYRPLAHSSLRWLFPLADSATYTRPGAVFPPPSRAYDGLAGFDVAAAGWHLLYLASLTIALAVLALFRYSARRRLLWVSGLALAVLGTAALPQLWA
jgi:hypothetical protein